MVNQKVNSKRIIYPGDTIGILGEGRSNVQLVDTAQKMGFKVATYVTSEFNEVSHHADYGYVGGLRDKDKLRDFAEKCKIVIYESEQVDIDTLKYLEQFVAIPQGTQMLEFSQDRMIEKATIEQMGIKMPPCVTIVDLDDLYRTVNEIGYPGVLRPILKNPLQDEELLLEGETDVPKANALLQNGTYVLQKWMDQVQEISITVVKDQNRRQKMFPMVENIYKNHRLKETRIPVDLPIERQNRLLSEVTKICDSLDYVGSFSIVFYVQENDIYLKRIIPGIHRTQNIFNLATNTTVYEETLRAVCGMLISDIRLQVPTIMLNIAYEQMSKIKTQWLIKDNWHFNFYPAVYQEMDRNHYGYVLADGDSIEQIQTQINDTDIW